MELAQRWTLLRPVALRGRQCHEQSVRKGVHITHPLLRYYAADSYCRPGDGDHNSIDSAHSGNKYRHVRARGITLTASETGDAALPETLPAEGTYALLFITALVSAAVAFFINEYGRKLLYIIFYPFILLYRFIYRRIAYFNPFSLSLKTYKHLTGCGNRR